MKPDYRPPSRSRLLNTPDGYCTVLCHARLGVPDETGFDHLVFPHAVHVEDVEVACTRCHSPEKHKMRVITRSECMNCHHEAQDIACGHCHPAQEALYTGKLAGSGLEEQPDPMADAEVECDGCHAVSSKMSIAAIQEACVDCHEAGYEEMVVDWINEVQDALARTALLAEEARRGIEAAHRQGREVGEAQGLLAQAETMVQAVEKGRGAHNFPLAIEVLEDADEDLRRALRAAEEGDATP
jgi:hypothetical protein